MRVDWSVMTLNTKIPTVTNKIEHPSLFTKKNFIHFISMNTAVHSFTGSTPRRSHRPIHSANLFILI